MRRPAELVLFCTLAAFATLGTAEAANFRVLYQFRGGADGGTPSGPPVTDDLHVGRIFGTTSRGGTGCGGEGCGVVYILNSKKELFVPYAFTGGADGAHPSGTLMPIDGVVMGLATDGGAGCGGAGCGTLFVVRNEGGLHRDSIDFDAADHGATPYSGISVWDHNIAFGTTSTAGPGGAGTVFQRDIDGNGLTLFHAFTGGADGGTPLGGLVWSKWDDLYGTTSQGGTFSLGTVFKIAGNGTFSVVHSFAGGTDGATPTAGLTIHKGELYGVTRDGGSASGGTVFKIVADGTESVLYNFSGGSDGRYPNSALLFGRSGEVYGTTAEGGGAGHGTIFKLASDGTESVLHSFAGPDGARPLGLVRMAHRVMWGTAAEGGRHASRCGGHGCGTIFQIEL